MRKPFMPNIRDGYVDVVRFWNKVDQSDPTGCWPFIGKRQTARGGYGMVFIKVMSPRGVAGKWEIASRIAYELCVGPLAPKDRVRHSCDNPPCVRPDHLSKGTQQDNAFDMMRRARQPSATLSLESVLAIRNQYATTPRPSLASLAIQYHVRPEAIWRVVTGQSWAWADGPIRELQPREKLRDHDVAMIRSAYSDGASQSDLSASYGVTPSRISALVRGRSRLNAGGPVSTETESRHRKSVAASRPRPHS